jgi:DNA-binding GntR family transcriptional regulator
VTMRAEDDARVKTADVNPAVSSIARIDTLTNTIDSVLEREIINGRLAPGTRLIAEELAEQFGVSRIPVREALRALDAAGWIEIRPRHGTYVRRWSISELDQLFEVRVLLEAEAARLSAKRASADDIAALRANCDEYVRAIERRLPTVPELNHQFHAVIARSTNNRVLQDYLEAIGKRVQWYFASVTFERSPESAREHVELIDAIERRDSRAAAKLMSHHVDRTREAIAAVFAARGDEIEP